MEKYMDLYDDNSERVFYNAPILPLHACKHCISDYPRYAAASHWHDDIEFVVIVSGQMQYNVNGIIYSLREGDGIFVNSRQLHFGYSADRRDCTFLCLLLHPILLCANHHLEQMLVAPLTSNRSFSCKPLSHTVPWENEILEALGGIYDAERLRHITYPLTVQSLFYRIWSLLFEQMPKTDDSEPSFHHLSSLKEMIGFIQTHYHKKITLKDIAFSGKVCKSSCCRIFRTYLHQSPIGFLTKYRLDKSIELLKTTDMNISEISYAAGFSGASYFAETFREMTGMTPSAYRNHTGRLQTPLV